MKTTIRRISRLLVMVLPWWVAVAGSAAARAEDVLFGISPFPPYAITGGDRPTGPAIEFYDRLTARAGMTPKYVSLPIKRAAYELLANKIDVWPSSLPPELLDKVIASQKIATISVSLARLADTPVVGTIEELAGNGVIVIFGYGYLGLRDKVALLQPPPDLIEAHNTDEALALLEIHRAPYLLIYDTALREALKKNPVKTTLMPLLKVEVFLLASRSNPRAAELIRRLDEAYRQMPAEDRLKADD